MSDRMLWQMLQCPLPLGTSLLGVSESACYQILAIWSTSISFLIVLDITCKMLLKVYITI